jgi:hypothetical protein
MHFIIIVGKFFALVFILMFANIGRRLFKVGYVPVGHGLRPDWSYYLRGLVSFAIAVGIAYFVFVR